MVHKKNKGGRPTALTPEVINKLEEAFGWGWSDRKSCDYAGISHPTLWKYQRKNPEFLKRKEMLKNNPGEIAKKNVIEAIRQGDIRLSQWYLEKRAAEFSTKKQVDINASHRLDAEQVALQLADLLNKIEQRRISAVVKNDSGAGRVEDQG